MCLLFGVRTTEKDDSTQKGSIMKRLLLALAVLLATIANIGWAQETPQILYTSPTQNELNVPVSTDILVVFDVDMDETTINDTTFVVNARSTGFHEGTITYDGQTKTATLAPLEDFDEGEVVTEALSTCNTILRRCSSGKQLCLVFYYTGQRWCRYLRPSFGLSSW